MREPAAAGAAQPLVREEPRRVAERAQQSDVAARGLEAQTTDDGGLGGGRRFQAKKRFV